MKTKNMPNPKHKPRLASNQCRHIQPAQVPFNGYFEPIPDFAILHSMVGADIRVLKKELFAVTTKLIYHFGS